MPLISDTEVKRFKTFLLQSDMRSVIDSRAGFALWPGVMDSFS